MATNTINVNEAIAIVRDFNANKFDAKTLAAKIAALSNTLIDNLIDNSDNIEKAFSQVNNAVLYSATISENNVATLYKRVTFIDIVSRAKARVNAKGSDNKTKLLNTFDKAFYAELEKFYQMCAKRISEEVNNDNPTVTNTRLLTAIQALFPTQFERDGVKLYVTKFTRQDIRFILDNLSRLSSTKAGSFKIVSFNTFCRVFNHVLFVRLNQLEYKAIDKENTRVIINIDPKPVEEAVKTA